MKSETVKALLRKIPLVLIVYLAGGAFCRWYQLNNELLYDGSLAEGAFMHRALLLLTLTFLVGFAGVLYGLKNIPHHRDCFSRHPAYVTIQILAGGFLISGCILQLLGTGEPVSYYTEISAALTRYAPYLGILAGICIIAFAVTTGLGKTPSPLLYMLVSIYMVIRLIVCFQTWNMDPSIHDYAYKLLATITCMLGCFQIGGFCFGKGKRRITLFWCLCAAFFCTISIPDHLGKSSELWVNLSPGILLLTHGLQLLYAPDPPEAAPIEELPSGESEQPQ